MKTLYLEKSIPARNCQRYYRLEAAPDLFGHWILRRAWGRIGRAGCERCQSFTDRNAAMTALDKLCRRKIGRGYVLS